MKQLTEFSQVKDGHLNIKVQKLVAEFLSFCEGKYIKIIIVLGRQRSSKQNSFYWAIFLQYMIEFYHESWGIVFTKEQCHDYCKNNFFCMEHLDENTGEVVKFPRSTKYLSTLEFEEGMQIGRDYYQINHNFTIPLPNEQLEIPENN